MHLPGTFTVVHDLPFPGSRATIDHIVMGPTGIFLVETKNSSHDVVIRSGAARFGNYGLGKVATGRRCQ
ncbi:MAG: NERD domain-containing protein [Acidimicrobiia bacterium]|nr:NERD domain-containing protein [Acidimicrobiia bacterium]